MNRARGEAVRIPSAPTSLLPAAAAGFLAGVLYFLLPTATLAQAPANFPSVPASRASEAPVVDGRLDDPAWATAPALEGFTQREPIEGGAPSQPTVVRILFDDAGLYVGVWAFDTEPSRIIPGENRRDVDLEQSDAISFVLDTFRDRQNGFVFGTTPAGIEFDGQVTREGQGATGAASARQQRGSGGGFNKNWDGSWSVATSQDDAGWYAEFFIPFSTLRYPDGESQSWGFNLSRRIRRGNEEIFWAPIPRQFNLFRVSLAGSVDELEVPRQRNAFITPYVRSSAERDFVASTEVDWEGAIGGDAKFTLTQSLALDLTVNTDFAQVEVDDAQVNLTRFPLFFPEKRPFFLENAGTFAVGSPQSIELFFSRRIGLRKGREVPILAGGRVTGRALGLNLGFLNIQTRATDVFDPAEGSNVPLAPNENYGAIRAFREMGNRTRLGGIFVSRLNTDALGSQDERDYNLTYGLDGRLGVGDYLTFDGFAAATETPGLEGDAYSYSLSADYDSRLWRWGAAFAEVGDAFNPEVGFLSRSDYRFTSLSLLRRVRFDQVEWFRELRPHVTYREFWNREGFTETRLIHIDSHFEFSNGAFFQLPAINFTEEGLTEPFEISDGVIIPAGSYNNVEWGFRANTDRSAPLSVEGRIDIGGFYSGTRYGTDATLNYRLADRFVASGRVVYYDVNLKEGNFETTLLSLKAAYSFTPRIFLQGTLQYLDQTGNFTGNVRFGWLNTAGTGLYVVYNDIEHLKVRPSDEVPEGALYRTLIVKFTRQFDLIR